MTRITRACVGWGSMYYVKLFYGGRKNYKGAFTGWRLVINSEKLISNILFDHEVDQNLVFKYFAIE